MHENAPSRLSSKRTKLNPTKSDNGNCATKSEHLKAPVTVVNPTSLLSNKYATFDYIQLLFWLVFIFSKFFKRYISTASTSSSSSTSSTSCSSGSETEQDQPVNIESMPSNFRAVTLGQPCSIGSYLTSSQHPMQHPRFHQPSSSMQIREHPSVANYMPYHHHFSQSNSYVQDEYQSAPIAYHPNSQEYYPAYPSTCSSASFSSQTVHQTSAPASWFPNYDLANQYNEFYLPDINTQQKWLKTHNSTLKKYQNVLDNIWFSFIKNCVIFFLISFIIILYYIYSFTKYNNLSNFTRSVYLFVRV